MPWCSGNFVFFLLQGFLGIFGHDTTVDIRFSSVQSLSYVWLFATPWTAACQVSLSITNSQSSLKPMSIEAMMSSSHLILCCPLLLLPQSLPASGSFPMSQLFAWGGQSIGVSASASVLPMNTQDWLPLKWTGWISTVDISITFSHLSFNFYMFLIFIATMSFLIISRWQFLIVCLFISHKRENKSSMWYAFW